MVYGRTAETPLDDSRYDDLFAAAAALRQPIFIHPQIPSRTVREAVYGGFDPLTDLALATFGLGWHLEAAVAALVHITSSGMFDPALLRHVLEVTTPDRLLFSSDYPFQRPDKTDIEKFLIEFPTDEDRDKFTAGNACSLSVSTSHHGRKSNDSSRKWLTHPRGRSRRRRNRWRRLADGSARRTA